MDIEIYLKTILGADSHARETHSKWYDDINTTAVSNVGL